MFGFKHDQAGKDVQSSAAGLRDDSGRFEIIIQSISDGVIMIDDQQVIQLINPAAAVLCGWPVEEATGINVKSVLQLTDNKGKPRATDDNPFDQIFQLGQPIRDGKAYMVNRDKQQVPVSLSISPLFGDQKDEPKEVTAAIVVLSDVSEERAQEQQRVDFISTASHEMRTPVAAIEGYLALALNDKVSQIDSRARDYLEKAHSSTQHLGQLFQDLLTSAKAEDGRLTSHPTVIELGAFLEQLSNDLRLVAEKKGLAMEFTTGAGKRVIDATKTAAGGERVIRPLYYVSADSDRLREVITNLFDNAVKYTPEGKVSIGLTGDDNIVQTYVRDTGPGIPAEDLPHLFQKFYRVDSSATRTIGGTGLGLFICRKIVELYNGRIWAESELGKGSSFYINLPRLSGQKAAELQRAENSKTILKPIESNTL